MKKKSKIIILLISIILLGVTIQYIGFWAPYNLQGIRTENSFGIQNMSSFKEIDELSQYFKYYNISKVKYLGSNTYEVFTDKGNFIVIADYSDDDFWKYQIFKYDGEIQHFANPM